MKYLSFLKRDIPGRLRQSLRNRYVLVALLFLAWILFFDRSRLVSQESLQRDIAKLEEEKADYLRMIDDVHHEQQDIQKNREKYAREHYYMKRADEDVYIILED
jgi:cell division protein DivIC